MFRVTTSIIQQFVHTYSDSDYGGQTEPPRKTRYFTLTFLWAGKTNGYGKAFLKEKFQYSLVPQKTDFHNIYFMKILMFQVTGESEAAFSEKL